MHTCRHLAFVGAVTALTLPALCGTPNGLVGHWQHPVAGTSTVILDFRPDGTEHIVYRRGGRLLPTPGKDGRPIAATKYKVVGDKLVFTTLDGRHSETTKFKVQGDTLTFPPSDKDPVGNTLRRVK